MRGEVLRQARELKNLTQKDVGNMSFCSDRTISAFETGKRSMPIDTIARIATQLDYPRLFMEAAEEVTGGVYCSPWLDGEEVDLYRTSVWAKTIEELFEAEKSLENTRLINKKNDDESRAQIFESMMQALDARVAIDHYVAVICSEYQFSIQQVFVEHYRKLENRGYIKPRQKNRGCSPKHP